MASNLTRFNPPSSLRGYDPMRNFDDLFNIFDVMRPLRSLDTERIRMDVKETDQAYLVKADMPGFKKDDVKVSINGDQVTISADTNKEEEHTQGGTLCRERYHGQYYRSFTLPQPIDETTANATCHDGVLELTLPKKPGAAPHQITIQ
jgi:HSP20 family protein